LNTNNIFNKIKLHPLFYISLLLVVMTGQFKKFIIMMSIIIFHEMGHIVMAKLLKWKIEQILILPFGCLTIFDEFINKPLFEEFLVCISGPIFQIFYYVIMSNFMDISTIHYSLLIFNLLPIIPLDGSKILNLLLNKIFPFYSSQIISCIISLTTILVASLFLIFNNQNLMLLLTFLFLFIKQFQEIKNIKYIFNKFLLERYIQELKISKIKKIRGIKWKSMFRYYRHLFILEKNYYTEKQIIRKKFDLQRKVW